MSRFQVRKVAVLGAGVMGAQIAAHLVNCKVPVVLFDLPAKEGPKNGIVTKAVDGLSPEALLKLRRMQKLRALLNRVPSDVRQELRGRRAHNLGAAADAISMLASVATTM